MRTTIIALALLMAGAAAASAQTNAPAVNQTPTRTTTPSGPGAPTVTPQSPGLDNPAVNPDAAGLQRGWRGYGASQQQPICAGSGRCSCRRSSRS